MYKDLTGQLFGHLRVLKRSGVDKYRNVKWLCLCECGRRCETITNSLKLGRTVSCGCKQVEASRRTLPLGSKFNQLTVVAFAGVRKQRSMCLCVCDCGTEVVVQMHRLLQGITSSCGCARKTHGLSATPEYRRLCASRRRARKNNARGSHTIQDVLDLFEEQDGQCFYCQIDLDDFHRDHKTPLVRGGSDCKENLCLACPPCNRKKHTKTEKEFRKLMSLQVN